MVSDRSAGKDQPSRDLHFTEEVIRLAGEEVRTCIQCGTCSASCSTAHLMDKSIRRIIKLVLEGQKSEALAAQSVWLCTSCQLCTVRCPRNIRPKSVVAALRHIFERDGLRSADQAFEEMFMRQIVDCGRIREFTLSALYPLSNPSATVPIIQMGIELIPKGKITLEKSCVRGMDEIRRIFDELEEAGP